MPFDPTTAREVDSNTGAFDPTTAVEIPEPEQMTEAHRAYLERRSKGGQFAPDTGGEMASNRYGSTVYGAAQALGQIPGGIADLTLMTVPGLGLVRSLSPGVDKAVSEASESIQDLTPKAFQAAGINPYSQEFPAMKYPENAMAGEIGANLAPMGGGLPGAKVTEALNAASKPLRTSALKTVEQALDATGKTMKAKSARVAPEILDRPIKETFGFTKSQLAKRATGKAEEAGEAIEDFGKMKGSTKLKPILDSLENLKTTKNHIVEGKIMNPEAVQHIDTVKELIAQHGDVISNEALRNIKRGFDEATYGQKGSFPTYNEKTILNFKKVASDEIREELAKADPDLAKINKQFNFWSNFSDVAESSYKRTKSQKHLLPMVAGIAGAATAPTLVAAPVKALAFKTAMDAISSTGWKLTKAHMKNKLATALASNSPRRISDTLSLIPVANVTQLRKELNQPPQDIQPGEPLSAKIDGKDFKVSFVQKMPGDKYKVKTTDGKIKVIDPDDVGIAPTDLDQ